MKPILTRSGSDRSIFGICGGVAQFLGWSSTRLRLAVVVASLFTLILPAIIVYLCLLIVIPKPPNQDHNFDLDRYRVQ
ncbi:MAG: PspC domain-containing protein [Lentisphaeria bacterium]|nr:PspC domain-containing protein [Lentisphaeria bacterium]